jgi:hypothetical protein
LARILYIFRQIWIKFETGDLQKNLFEAYEFRENRAVEAVLFSWASVNFRSFMICCPFLVKFSMRDMRIMNAVEHLCDLRENRRREGRIFLTGTN